MPCGSVGALRRSAKNSGTLRTTAGPPAVTDRAEKAPMERRIRTRHGPVPDLHGAPRDRIVFLDIDGVLNSIETILGPESEIRAGILDSQLVGRLNRILSATGAAVVVSSTWRELFDVRELQRRLESYGFSGLILGTTPIRADNDREAEILAWLERHGPVRFVILDDRTDFYDLAGRLVQTTLEKGLQDVHVDRAIELMDQEGP